VRYTLSPYTKQIRFVFKGLNQALVYMNVAVHHFVGSGVTYSNEL
jgi:hypothetical protein